MTAPSTCGTTALVSANGGSDYNSNVLTLSYTSTQDCTPQNVAIIGYPSDYSATSPPITCTFTKTSATSGTFPCNVETQNLPNGNYQYSFIWADGSASTSGFSINEPCASFLSIVPNDNPSAYSDETTFTAQVTATAAACIGETLTGSIRFGGNIISVASTEKRQPGFSFGHQCTVGNGATYGTTGSTQTMTCPGVQTGQMMDGSWAVFFTDSMQDVAFYTFTISHFGTKSASYVPITRRGRVKRRKRAIQEAKLRAAARGSLDDVD